MTMFLKNCMGLVLIQRYIFKKIRTEYAATNRIHLYIHNSNLFETTSYYIRIISSHIIHQNPCSEISIRKKFSQRTPLIVCLSYKIILKCCFYFVRMNSVGTPSNNVSKGVEMEVSTNKTNFL